MTLEFLVHSALAGLIATYVLMVFAQWADRYGLPRVDFAHEQAELTLRDVVHGAPAYFIGLGILHMNGVVFSLLYSSVFAKYIPTIGGYEVIRGIIYGEILFVLAGLIYVPIFFRIGFFAVKAHPFAWTTSMLVHGIFGAIVGWLGPVAAATS